jgi:hypothetical protein
MFNHFTLFRWRGLSLEHIQSWNNTTFTLLILVSITRHSSVAHDRKSIPRLPTAVTLKSLFGCKILLFAVKSYYLLSFAVKSYYLPSFAVTSYYLPSFAVKSHYLLSNSIICPHLLSNHIFCSKILLFAFICSKMQLLALICCKIPFFVLKSYY